MTCPTGKTLRTLDSAPLYWFYRCPVWWMERGTYPAFLPVVAYQRHQADVSHYLPHVSAEMRSCSMAPGPVQPCMAMVHWERDDKQHTGSYAAMFRTMSVSVKFRAVIGCNSPS